MTQFSSANRPDLDWSQVRETVKLLTVSVTQVENSMKVGDGSVNALTASFTGMVEHLQGINAALTTMPDSDTKQAALAHCVATSDTINSSIMAFQFYDRLQQCLEHVSLSLKGLSELVESPERLYNPQEWKIFQENIRNRYTMESEKIMFDAIVSGKTIEEALVLAATAAANVLPDDDDIELF
ncbi:MAG: hypothetical protein NTV00_12905 [Methylococcales bacterium]|nr:hypothetical protein [Methylococcales bacterium]